MSRNVITLQGAGGEVRIAAGWDNPLREVFCNILPADDEDKTDYSRVGQTSFSDGAEIASFLKSAHGFDIPQTMVEAIDRDIAEGARNVYRQFDSDGTLVQEHRF